MIKNLIKKIVFGILTVEARLVLARYRPKIIAVTGTVGKTTTKDAIYKALSKRLHVRKNSKSLNSEIGVPLTILGLETGWSNPIHWLSNILIGLVEIIYWPKYPKYLVLEVGIDRPGDMEKVARWLKPDVAVLTAFGDVPVHVEFFDSPDQVAEEKSKLISHLKKDGAIILNADDEKVLKLKNRAEHRVYTFGKKNGEADIVASHYSIVYETSFGKDGHINSGHRIPHGVSFKINYNGNSIPMAIRGAIGDQYVYPILAALATGISQNLPLVSMSEGLSEFKAPKGRMNLLAGENDSIIVDDSYNSSPIAAASAVRNLTEIDNVGSKIAVLGDMTEIGRFSASEHRKIGSLIRENKIDILITVGRASELINEQAMEEGMAKSKNYHFSTSTEAIQTVRNYLKLGNVILVKGSQAMRMEKITKAILLEKEKAADLIVRQEKEWLNR